MVILFFLLLLFSISKCVFLWNDFFLEKVWNFIGYIIEVLEFRLRQLEWKFCISPSVLLTWNLIEMSMVGNEPEAERWLYSSTYLPEPTKLRDFWKEFRCQYLLDAVLRLTMLLQNYQFIFVKSTAPRCAYCKDGRKSLENQVVVFFVLLVYFVPISIVYSFTIFNVVIILFILSSYKNNHMLETLVQWRGVNNVISLLPFVSMCLIH